MGNRTLGRRGRAHQPPAHTFTGEDINFLQAVANTLALAIERREAEAELGNATPS